MLVDLARDRLHRTVKPGLSPSRRAVRFVRFVLRDGLIDTSPSREGPGHSDPFSTVLPPLVDPLSPSPGFGVYSCLAPLPLFSFHLDLWVSPTAQEDGESAEGRKGKDDEEY